MDCLFVGRDFDPFNLLQFFDTALDLLGLRGLRTKSIDERFQLLDTFLLILICGFELRLSLGLLRQELLVIPRVKIDPLVPELGDLVHGHIKEIPVVRN
jgi:hypothetical protein